MLAAEDPIAPENFLNRVRTRTRTRLLRVCTVFKFIFSVSSSPVHALYKLLLYVYC